MASDTLDDTKGILPSSRRVRLLRSRVIGWFKAHGRDYPWRQTRDPYRLLIAEMMLRRTKADQVKGVYSKLLRKYPDARALAGAPKADVERILFPLGLKWRTPAFQRLATIIDKEYQGNVPENREELRALPGVGDYVAGAVLSIGFGKREWIVDSNIVRVFSRYFGIETSREGRRDKAIVELAKAYASGRDVRSANLAILDFAALICTSRNPRHEECPVRTSCWFFLRCCQGSAS